MMTQLFDSTHVIAIGSGKGGVGKSTVAVNVAVALAQQGLKVGLLDADIYGPSIPLMLGLRRLRPPMENQQVTPLTKFGVQVISLGFFMEEARSVIWRGPMIHGTLEKFLYQIQWGTLDFLILDLPPGTGDVLLSLSQLLSIRGAVVVCTPQEAAMVDALKAINAFNQLEIPLLGVVENMAGFVAPDTGKIYQIFGQGKAEELAHRFHIPLLTSIALISSIREGGDQGIPCALQRNETSAPFYQLATSIQDACLHQISNPFSL
jgi:ATP-binding protein involved in chromosome partitioning